MDPVANIDKYLTRVRRRLRFLVVVRATGVLVAALGLWALVLVLGASVLSERSSSLRTLGLSLATIATIGYLLHLAISFARSRHRSSLALIVGQAHPGLRSDLVSTVELARQARKESSRFSKTLFAALADQTWRDLRNVSVVTIVPPSLLQPAVLLLALASLAWATAGTGLPDRVQRGASRLLASASSRGGGRVATRLLIADLKLHYRYPKHMTRIDRLVQSTTGHITAPKGTRIKLVATTRIPISRATLSIRWLGRESEEGLELELTDGGATLEGQMIVLADGQYRFAVQTPDGKTLIDPVQRRIHLQPDALPRITLFGPPDGLEVTDDQQLEVGYTVEDDYGLRKVQLVYQVGSDPPQQVPLWRSRSGKPERATAGKHLWDLASVDLYPGAQVAYRMEAIDNDTISGPKVGSSQTRTFKVYSAEEKHAETLRQHQMLVEQALRILADRLLLFQKEPDISPGLRITKNQAINRSHAGFVDGLRELRNSMRQDKLVPESVLRSIGRLHQRAEILLKAEIALLRSATAIDRRRQVRPVHLARLRNQNDKQVAVMENGTLLLANLLDEQRLQSLMTLSRAIQEGRKRLDGLLKQYRKTRDDRLKKEILQHIRRMKRQIERLMAQASKLSGAIPDEYLNMEAMRSMDLRDELSHIARMVNSGRLGKVESALRALDEKLQQMQDMLSGNLQHFRQGRMNAREKAYGAMMDRLRGLEEEQREIAKRTARIVRHYHQRAAQVMQHKINPFVRRELKKLVKLRRRVNEIDASSLAAYDQEQLARIKQRVQDLEGMLDQGDLDQALRMALRTRNGLQLLQDDLSEELEGQVAKQRGRIQRALRRTGSALKLADELVGDLKGIFPHPRSLLDGEDRGKLKGLQTRQRRLHQRLKQLDDQLAKDDRKKALFGHELRKGLGESGHLMDKAAGKLRNLQPQEAHGSQEAAADRLSRLVRQIRQGRQPPLWSHRGPSVMRQQIPIPGADAFRPPKEFRKDILDAMKEKPPKAFQHQVKQYYEELVR